MGLLPGLLSNLTLIWEELIHVRMPIPILFWWQIPGILHDCFRLALRLLAKSDASSLLISIFMTERTGFPLIHLHRMNLRFDVRIGKILLHFKRMFVYIALQGRCGLRWGILLYSKTTVSPRRFQHLLKDISFGAFFTQSFLD